MTDFKMLSDEQLVALVKADNAEAFKTLYNRYWKKILIKAYTQLNSYETAEEIVQDAFINFWNRRYKIELKYSFHTYIASVVKYEVMACLARNGKRSMSYIDDLKIAEIEDHATQQWLDFDDLKNQIEKFVQLLPDKCQLVFKLSRDKGLTDKQISKDLDISQKTVEAHLTKALKSLRLSINNLLT
jgi:RNA polymerase sigma-70 factor (family 1)